MSTIDLARAGLAEWEARVAHDTEALATAEQRAANVRERLAASTKIAADLRRAVQEWDALQARHKTPNAGN